MTCSHSSQSKQNSENISEKDLISNVNIQAEIDAIKIEMLDMKTKLNSLFVPTTESEVTCAPIPVSVPETSNIDVVVHDSAMEVSNASIDEDITEIENPSHNQSN